MTNRLVVLGGGTPGMPAASAARRVDPALEIVVVERTGSPVYDPLIVAAQAAQLELAVPA
jgi:NADH dehydrogenase FAD-containing subunit